MPRLNFPNNSEISSCIISKVKFALGLKSIPPTNNKKCSDKYWNEVVEIIASKYNINDRRQIDNLKK